MKKLITIIFSALLISSTLSACQETPETPIVVGKGDAALENAIKENTVSEAQASEYLAPETLTYEETKNDVSLNIDATITVPENATYSALAIKRIDITQEMADKVLEVFVGDNRFIEVRTDEDLSKSELETKILSYQEKNNSDKFGSYIQKLQDLYVSAPEDAILTDATRVFTEKDYAAEYKAGGLLPENPTEQDLEYFENDVMSAKENYYTYEIIGDVLEDSGKTGELLINENYVQYELKGTYYRHEENTLTVYDDSFSPPIATENIGKDAALEYAQSLINDLGLTHLTLSDTIEHPFLHTISGSGENIAVDNRPFYVFTFTRESGGVNESNLNGTGFIDSQLVFNQGLRSEVIEITVGDYGLMSFLWESPTEEVETVSQNIELLGFEEIEDIIKNQMFLSYTNNYAQDFANETIESSYFNIEEIRLGMSTVLRQGTDEYLFIPVWEVIGRDGFTFEDKTLTSETALGFLNDFSDLGNGNLESNEIKSYLTINAIDGSIIDRDKGY